MEKTTGYFLELTDEQFHNELPILFQLLNEEKITKSQDLAEILLKFPNEITPFIFDMFESGTSNIRLKVWSLETIVPQLPFFVKIALEDTLQRLANSPTDEEKLVGLDEKAATVLNGFI